MWYVVCGLWFVAHLLDLARLGKLGSDLATQKAPTDNHNILDLALEHKRLHLVKVLNLAEVGNVLLEVFRNPR